MTVSSHQECQRDHRSQIHAPSQLCAGKGNLVEGTTCQGDSGGPLVIQNPSTKKWELVGATSFGRSCIDAAVFTRVSFFKDWILNEMAKN